MLNKLRRTEVWFKLVLLMFFGVFCILGISFPAESRQFPHLIGISTLILIVISLLLDFTKKGKQATEITGADDSELTVGDAKTKQARKKRFLQAWGIILISTAIGFLGGFLFTAFFLLVGFAILFGKKENLVKNMILTVVITVATYLTFQYFMDVPLLGGALW